MLLEVFVQALLLLPLLREILVTPRPIKRYRRKRIIERESVCEKERVVVREKEREKETDRQTERETEGETERDSERERGRDKYKKKEVEVDMEIF